MLKKENVPMVVYLLRIKAIVDALTSISYSIPTQDHLDAIFDGLHEEYNAFVICINTRLEPFTMPEIEFLLLAHEAEWRNCLTPLYLILCPVM